MTKQEFLSKLEETLAKIPPKDRKDILYDYEEHFINGVASGKSEEQLVCDLGTPQSIGKEILADYHVAQAVENISVNNIVRAVLATVSLGFVNLVFVLGPFLGVVGVLFAFYTATFVMIIVPVLLPFKVGLPYGLGAILRWIFTSMMAMGAGALLGVSMIFVTRWVGKVFLKYLQFNVQIIRGK